jgi:hypothetical protein
MVGDRLHDLGKTFFLNHGGGRLGLSCARLGRVLVQDEVGDRFETVKPNKLEG